MLLSCVWAVAITTNPHPPPDTNMTRPPGDASGAPLWYCRPAASPWVDLDGPGVVLRVLLWVVLRVRHALQPALPFDQPTYGQTSHCPTSPRPNLSLSSRCRAAKGSRPPCRPPQNMVNMSPPQSHPLLQVCCSARSRTAPTGTAVVLVQQVVGQLGGREGWGDPVQSARPRRPTEQGVTLSADRPTEQPTDRPSRGDPVRPTAGHTTPNVMDQEAGRSSSIDLRRHGESREGKEEGGKKRREGRGPATRPPASRAPGETLSRPRRPCAGRVLL